MDTGRLLESLMEADLIARVGQQDSEAFACLYDRTAPVLFSVAHSVLRDAALAEDVLQEVYLQIWNKAETYDAALGKPIAWCIAMTRNKALDRLRSSKRREAAYRDFSGEQEGDLDASKPAQSDVELRDVAELAKRAMENLPEKQRRAIELSLWHGLPHAEIAEAMQEPLGTVKAWIRRGIIELREQLKNDL